MKYPRATIAKKSGARNLQACVTVPLELRDIVGRKQVYKALGTNDEKIASQRLAEAEKEIYRIMDDANVLSHPLCSIIINDPPIVTKKLSNYLNLHR